MLIRPVKDSDLGPLMELASHTGYGLTNLPADRELLAKHINGTVELLEDSNAAPSGDSYLLVMEDSDTGNIVGTGALFSRINGELPFYVYLIETHIKESPSLGIREEMACLHLLEINDPWSEIGALFVHPAYQGKSHGRLMSLSRFLFLSAHLSRFNKVIIAEMRGVSGPDGKRPFWEGLGRHFFKMPFPKADYLSAKDKHFIAELMPRHPIYTVLLSESAREAIGHVHTNTRPALKLLTQEGFKKTQMIDIFDGGPVVRCQVHNIRTVRESKVACYCGPITDITDRQSPEQSAFIIATGYLNTFRACLGTVLEAGADQVRVSANAVDHLMLNMGDKIRYVAFRTQKEKLV